MTVRHVLWAGFPGQSNNYGTNPGGSGSQTLAAVDYYDVLLPSTTPALTQVLHALDDTHGKDFELGKALNAAGYKTIIVNVCKGSTYANDWIPGGTYYAAGIAEMQRAWTLIQAKYPGDTFIHHHIADQGEEDARYPTSGIPSLWASNFAQSHAGLASSLGITFSKIWINKTHSTLNNGTPGLYSTLVNSLQLQAAGSASHFLDRDGYDWEPGGLHLTTAGYIQNGQALAAMIIAGTPMGTIATAKKNQLLNHQLNKVTYTPAATIYAHAYVAGVRVTGNGYAPASLTNNTTNWTHTTTRTKVNANPFNFPGASGGDWGVVDEIRLYEDLAGTDEIGRCTLASPQNVVNGGAALSVLAGAVTLADSGSGFSTAKMASLLNLLLGGEADAQLATVYWQYYQGAQSTGGTPQGGRVAVTQNTTWNDASNGIASTSADVTIADQALATWLVEFDAAAAGNMLFEAALPVAPPTQGKVPAGQARTLFA
jgi:hypothetical protein